MFSFAPIRCVAPSSPRPGAFARRWRWLGAGVAVIGLAGALAAEEPAGPAEPVKGEFGKAIQLAPFVVQGNPPLDFHPCADEGRPALRREIRG